MTNVIGGVLNDVMEDDWLVWYTNAQRVAAMRSATEPRGSLGRMQRDANGNMKLSPCDPGDLFPKVSVSFEARQASNASWLATVRWEIVPKATEGMGEITREEGKLFSDQITQQKRVLENQEKWLKIAETMREENALLAEGLKELQELTARTPIFQPGDTPWAKIGEAVADQKTKLAICEVKITQLQVRVETLERQTLEQWARFDFWASHAARNPGAVDAE